MVIHPAVQSLLDEIEAFRGRTTMSATAFGVDALNDPKFIPDLLTKGRSPSLKTAQRVRDFMRSREAAAA